MITSQKWSAALLLCVTCLTPGVAPGGDPGRRLPTVDDLLQFKSVGAGRISPHGTRVAYTVTHTDFMQDAFVTHLWLADVATGRTQQLTRGDKSAGSPAWSPDGRWVAFTSDRAGDKSQIFAISPDGGEAVQLTKADSGVNSFAWSPNGRIIAFTATPTVKDAVKDRKEHLGDFVVVRKE